jgi:hypothetical protein
MLQKVMKMLVAALPITLVATDAFCGDQIWGLTPPSRLPGGFVGADYTHDDGGPDLFLQLIYFLR